MDSVLCVHDDAYVVYDDCRRMGDVLDVLRIVLVLQEDV
jgi:hypothetical protein